MATKEEVLAALTQAAADAAAEKAEVAANIQTLTDQITALKDQVANGGVVTAADLDTFLASIQGIDSAVKDITTPIAPA